MMSLEAPREVVELEIEVQHLASYNGWMAGLVVP